MALIEFPLLWHRGQSIEEGVLIDGERASYADVLERWRDDADFREVFRAQLAAAPFPAFLWETPPVTTATLDRPYEHALIDSATLARSFPEPEAFGEHFAPRREVVSFASLGGDALLIAPCPRRDQSYPHLAAFVRSAPAAQQHAFWRAVADGLERELGERRRWLSTSGLGVAWLHARIDERPKYYAYAPYREGA